MDIAVTFKGGGSIVKLKPAFSDEGENVFVALKNSIFQYNTKTGKLITEYQGWNDEIIGFCYNIIDNLECIIGCSKTGKIIIWKIKNKMKVLEVQINFQNISHFFLMSTQLTKGLKILITYKTKNNKVAFAKINTKSLEKNKIIFKIPKNSYDIDVCHNYLSVVSDNAVYFVDFKTSNINRYFMSENNRKFTCVTCHPNSEMVLTGDDTGRVVLWQNIFGKPTQAVFHWHTLPVECIAFSKLGSYFYSGANECVLVKWQINNPGQKQFLPRLPAGIAQLTVSDNNAFVAVGTADNAIRIIDSQMNQVSLIQRLVLGDQFESGMVYDPITRALVMNGNIGCVQFYSPNDMSLLYNIDIVNQNKVTAERESKLENTDVRKIALSASGKWLASIEERRENTACKEVRLKFWFFNTEKQTYELNTSIEFPHEGSINSLQLQPVSAEEELKCISIGNDKSFKIWQVFEVATVHRTGPVWHCVNVGTFRNLPCHGLSFSIDGSLFATAFGPILTVWASDNGELKTSLIHSKFKEKINLIQFGRGNQCHLIASASKTQLCVWNILTLTMSWVVNLKNISLLISDPLSTHMVLICSRGKNNKFFNRIFVFELSSPTILYSSKELLGSNKQILAATFVPSMYSNDTRLQWYERTNLYFITSKCELYCVSKSEEPLEYRESYEDLSEQMSVFTKMQPQVRKTEVTLDSKTHMFAKDSNSKSYREYLESPIETLPPIRLLAVSLLQSLVLQREVLPEKDDT